MVHRGWTQPSQEDWWLSPCRVFSGGQSHSKTSWEGKTWIWMNPQAATPNQGYTILCSSLVRLTLCLHVSGWCLELGLWRGSMSSLISMFYLEKDISVIFFPLCHLCFKCPLLIAWELGLTKCMKMHIQFKAGVCLWNMTRTYWCGKISFDGLHWRRKLGFSWPNPWACEGVCNRILH